MEAPQSSTLLRKKSVGDVNASLLDEPAMSSEDWREYAEGWRLFNERKFWHAHEAWENVWKRHPEESRIFFQGIIQLAAAYHLLLEKKRYGGTMRNFEKAEFKLKLFPPRFLRVDVKQLLDAIAQARDEIGRVGEPSLDSFNLAILPTVVFE